MLGLNLKSFGFIKITIIALVFLLAIVLYLQDNQLATLDRYGIFVSNSSTPFNLWLKNSNWLSGLKHNQDHVDIVRNKSTLLQEIMKNFTVRAANKVLTARAYANQEQKFIDYRSFCQGNFITVGVSAGRWGNLMFQTASLFGISRKLQRQAFFLSKDGRFDSFEGFWMPSPMPQYGNCSWKKESFKLLPEAGAGVYTSKLEHQNLTKEVKPILLYGFLQSWRYFDDLRGSIKLLFTFKQSIYDQAIKVISEQLRKFFLLKEPTYAVQPVLVGIHVRRGDYVGRPNGLAPAPDDYLLNQLTEFRAKYDSVVFFITSEDLNYCRKLFKGDDVFVLDANPPEVDMAVLSLTNHVVVSVGSFGWWIAYLSDAQSVTYYEPWVNQSVLKNEYPKEDYFLPEWHGRDK